MWGNKRNKEKKLGGEERGKEKWRKGMPKENKRKKVERSGKEKQGEKERK